MPAASTSSFTLCDAPGVATSRALVLDPTGPKAWSSRAGPNTAYSPGKGRAEIVGCCRREEHARILAEFRTTVRLCSRRGIESPGNSY